MLYITKDDTVKEPVWSDPCYILYTPSDFLGQTLSPGETIFIQTKIRFICTTSEYIEFKNTTLGFGLYVHNTILTSEHKDYFTEVAITNISNENIWVKPLHPLCKILLRKKENKDTTELTHVKERLDNNGYIQYEPIRKNP